ncbi:MAG: hypothetical protein AAF533_19735 [Acidobacteriota bacterium]
MSNASPPAAKAPSSRFAWGCLWAAVGLLGACTVSRNFPPMYLYQLPWFLGVGWLSYLGRVLPQVVVRMEAILTGLVLLGALLGGGHLFLRRLPMPKPRSEDETPLTWSFRSTAAVVGLLVLTFVAGLASVGLVSQVRRPLTMSVEVGDEVETFPVTWTWVHGMPSHMKTKKRMDELHQALLVHHREQGGYPVHEGLVSEVLERLEVESTESRDYWGVEMLYVSDGTSYTIRSFAEDQRPGGPDVGFSEDYSHDIVYVDGEPVAGADYW